jgi:hypothetical protein
MRKPHSENETGAPILISVASFEAGASFKKLRKDAEDS